MVCKTRRSPGRSQIGQIGSWLTNLSDPICTCLQLGDKWGKLMCMYLPPQWALDASTTTVAHHTLKHIPLAATNNNHLLYRSEEK